MCLRDVTSERYEQADGVLCGRDHGGFRRVGDDDAAPRRSLDVHVVDADAGSADHLQSRRALDQVARELRRGTNDDRVVVADRLGKLGVAVDVDVEPFAQEPDACICDLLANENSRFARHTCARSVYASSARVTAIPRSISAPASRSASSSAASAVVMSNTSNQPM